MQLHASRGAPFEPLRAGFEALAAVRHGWPGQFEWRTNRVGIHNFDKLAGSDSVRRAIDAGTPVDELLASWARDRTGFEVTRQKYLQYPL